MSENFNNLLGGKVTPSASFKGQFPIAWEGVVEDAVRNPAYEYDPSKPNNRGAQKFWADGNPVMNLWVTLLTDVRTEQDDDGRRILVLDSKNKLEAVQAAVRESRTDFEKGGRLLIEWYGNDPNGKNPDNPPKLYRARYSPPSLGGLLDNGQAPPTPAAQAPAWGQQPPAPAPGAPATGGWGSPPPQAAQGWGAQPAAPVTTPAASPTAATAGWGAPAAPVPAPAAWGSPAPAADPVTPQEYAEALRKKGVNLPPGSTQQSAESIWALVKGNPDVA